MTLLAQTDRLAAGLGGLPWWGHLPVALALIAGLILWLAGRKVLRPVSILMGLAGGGLLGFLLLPTAVPSVGISPYIGILGGATSGLVVALLVSHIVSAATFGASLGAGCGLLTAAILGSGLILPAAAATSDTPPWGTGIGGGEQPVYIAPQPIPTPVVDDPDWEGPDPTDVDAPATKPAPKLQQRPKKPVAAAPPAKAGKPRTALTPTVRAEVGDAAAKARGAWGALREEWNEWWSGRDAKQRWWIATMALTGVVVGTLIGLLLPAWSAGAATALVGSAVWMAAAVWLGRAFNAPVIAKIHWPALGWVLAWGAVAMVGVAAQWYGLIPVKDTKGKRKRKKPEPEE